MEARYIYATYRTLQRARDALEDMFASGDVTEAERPQIDGPERVQITANGVTSWAHRYHITLPM